MRSGRNGRLAACLEIHFEALSTGTARYRMPTLPSLAEMKLQLSVFRSQLLLCDLSRRLLDGDRQAGARPHVAYARMSQPVSAQRETLNSWDADGIEDATMKMFDHLVRRNLPMMDESLQAPVSLYAQDELNCHDRLEIGSELPLGLPLL
jgi:hypothetical protein